MADISLNFSINGENHSFIICTSENSAEVILDSFRQGDVEGAAQKFRRNLMLRQVFSRGRTIFDLGCNVGMFSLPYARLGYTVHAFDGSLQNVALVKRSARANKFDRYYAHCFAVSDREGYVGFVERGNTGHVVWGDQADGTVSTSEYYVKSVSLDNFPWFSDFSDVAFIKMDIEGSEVRALNGMRNFLDRCGYPPVYIEVNGFCLGRNGYTPDDIFAYFRKLGYYVYAHDLDDYFVEYPDGVLQPFHLHDFLMTRKPLDGFLVKPQQHDAPYFQAAFFEIATAPAMWEQRYYAAAMLRAKPALRDDPRYAETVRALKSDEHPEVRAVAEQLPL